MPEAIINYLALLGWNPGDEREDFTLEQLVELFEFSNVQKNGAVFDMVKFQDVNQRWMRKLSDEEFLTRGGFDAPDRERLLKAAHLLKERAHTFGEAREMLSGELSCLFKTPSIDPALLKSKEPAEAPGATKGHLEALKGLIEALPEGSGAEEAKAALMPYADKEGRGVVLWPLRYALSGAERSPDPFTLVSILGPKDSLLRIQAALDIL